jgi:hypothetical protein
MRFGASILESVASITSQVVKGFAKQVGDLFNKAQPNIQRELRTRLADAIRSQPEYGSLKSGSLRYEFGLADASVVDSLVNRFVESIYVTTKNINTSSTKINAELVFSIIANEDLDNILSSSDANIVTEKGDVLPWLNWLLLRGNEPIILTHRILIKPSPYSRTGQAIMIPTAQGSWRVPQSYIGTVDNNWITRALSSIEDDISNILAKHIK